MTFCQTVFTDGDVPANSALSSPILIDITNDDIFEGVEYFQARIVETSDRFRVRIGQDTVNITITDSESCMFGKHVNPYHSTTIVCRLFMLSINGRMFRPEGLFQQLKCCERRLFIWLQSGDVTIACVVKVNTMIGYGTKTEVTFVEGVIG